MSPPEQARCPGNRPACKYNREPVSGKTAMAESSSSVIVRVVEQARGRASAQLALREITEAAAIAVLGPLILLLFGTEWFPPGLMTVFLLAGPGYAIYHWFSRRPTSYAVARRLDASWDTEDQIATAYYFDQRKAGAEPFAEHQRLLATPLAYSGDLVAAYPFRVPTAGYWFFALLLSSFGLLGIRYGVLGSLDLQPPLPAIVMHALFGEDDRPEYARQDEAGELNEGGEEAPQSLRREKELERDEQEEIEAAPSPPSGQGAPAEGAAEGDGLLPEVEGLSIDEEFGDELAGSGGDESGEGEAGAEESPEGGPGDTEMASAPEAEAGLAKREDGAPSEPANDLLARLQEAFKNMLSSLNPEKSSREPADPSGAEEGSEQPSEAAETGAQEGGEGEESAENASESQSGGAASPENPQELTQGEGSSQSSSSSPEGETASSSGSNEGSKAISESEKLQVMGKLEEFYQQRADDMIGEVQIETRSAPQQLQTPYAPTAATHRDRGGLVSRDQIPHAYRGYIRRYFEGLRRGDSKNSDSKN